jgi:hypothetical protein
MTQFTDAFIPGAAWASVILHQTVFSFLVLHKLIPHEMALELLDGHFSQLRRCKLMRQHRN